MDQLGLLSPPGDQCAQRLHSVPGAEQNEEVQTLVPIRSATRKAGGALGGG